MIRLQDLFGLWRRKLIAWPDDRADTETEVFWLQGPCHYADLRIPAGRPACQDVTGLRDLDWTMLRFMARQEGFFGRFDVVDSVGHWQRAFDYQPETGLADCGALAFEDDFLVERGVDIPYIELWLRQSRSREALALLLATETGLPGCLVVAGDAFIYARGRAAPLPPGSTLNELIDDAASLQAAQDIFDCEISFGRRQINDHAGVWRVERSSHCFREGATLSPALDGATGALVIDDVTPEGANIKRAWRITAHESTDNTPLSFWFGSGGVEEARGSAERTRNAEAATLGASR